MFKIDTNIKLDGETWTIVNIGATRCAPVDETVLHVIDPKDPAQRRGMVVWVEHRTFNTRSV